MTIGFEALDICNEEAEQAVIGAVLLDETLARESILIPENFYRGIHQIIWQAVMDLNEDNSAVDVVTLSNKLRSDGKLEEVGGLAYLSALGRAVPTAANFGWYQNIVLDTWKQRRAASIMNGALEEMAVSRETDLIGTTITRLTAIEETGFKESENGLKATLMEIYEETEAAMLRTEELTGIETGFTDLDTFTNGLQNNDLIILAARPSMGKTAMALNLGVNAAEIAVEKFVRASPEDRADVIPVGVDIFSLEMDKKSVTKRMMSATGNLDANHLRRPKRFFQSEDWERMAMSSSRLADLDINVYDDVNISVQEIRSKVRRNVKEARKKHPKARRLVIIDYLQLIRGSGRHGNREQEISDISRNLKLIARELDVTIIALSQLSRSVEQRQDKRPYMSDLRESGAIEQDADIIAFLYRDDYYNAETEKKNIVEMIIGKHRNGPTGTIEMVFIKNFNKFVNYERTHADVDRSNREPSSNRD